MFWRFWQICISIYCVSTLSLHIESTDSMIHDCMLPDVGHYGIVDFEDLRFHRPFCACEQES